MGLPFEELPWDSATFGFKVARWTAPLESAALAAELPGLRDAGIQLLYLFGEATRSDDEVALSDLGVEQVDRKVVFSRELPERSATVIQAETLPMGEPTAGLRNLARVSGTHSRFRVDPRMPEGCFEALYDAWIRRSTRREIADEVLIFGTPEAPLGLVTLRRREEVATIGLLAVASEARGRGLGRGLVSAAEGWAARAGARRMEVATQAGNLEACRLYGKCGYTEVESMKVYHLWMEAEAP